MRKAVAILIGALVGLAAHGATTNIVANKQGIDSSAAWVRDLSDASTHASLLLWMPMPSASGLTNNYIQAGGVITNNGATWADNVAGFSGSASMIGPSALMPTNAPWTVALWCKITNAVALQYAFSASAGSGSTLHYHFNTASGGVMRWRLDTTSGTSLLDDAIASYTNTWRHAALTYNGTSVVSYADGKPIVTNAATGPLSFTPANVGVGGVTAFGPYYWSGGIDDVRIYGTALTASQISNQLYRVFKGKYGL